MGEQRGSGSETRSFIQVSQQIYETRKYVYLNINQLDALNFIMSLFHASTCFEHTCSSSGG